jgi:hypothetical protein
VQHPSVGEAVAQMTKAARRSHSTARPFGIASGGPGSDPAVAVVVAVVVVVGKGEGARGVLTHLGSARAQTQPGSSTRRMQRGGWVDEVDEVDEVGGREQRRVGAGVQRAANLVEGGVRRRVRWHRIVSLRQHEGWQAGDGAAVSGDVVGRQSGRGRACWGCATFGGEEAGRRIWGGSTGDGGQRSQGGMWDVGCGCGSGSGV